MSGKYMVERLQKLLKWREYIPALREAISQVLPDAEIYIIGGAAENRLTALSDIDVLIITDKPPENPMKKAEITSKIREKLEEKGINHSYLYQFHIKDKKQAQQLLKTTKIPVKIR